MRVSHGKKRAGGGVNGRYLKLLRLKPKYYKRPERWEAFFALTFFVPFLCQDKKGSEK